MEKVETDRNDGRAAPWITMDARSAAVVLLPVVAMELLWRLAIGPSVTDSLTVRYGEPAALVAATGMIRAMQAVWMLAAAAMFVPRSMAGMGFGKERLLPGTIWGLGFVALMAAGMGTWAVLGLALPRMPALSGLLGLARLDGDTALLVLPASVLAAPLAEELAFRGALHGALRGPVSPVASALVVSALFAAAHLSGPWYLFLAGGIVFVGLMEASRSLWAPLIAHGLGNLLLLVAANLGI